MSSETFALSSIPHDPRAPTLTKAGPLQALRGAESHGRKKKVQRGRRSGSSATVLHATGTHAHTLKHHTTNESLFGRSESAFGSTLPDSASARPGSSLRGKSKSQTSNTACRRSRSRCQAPSSTSCNARAQTKLNHARCRPQHRRAAADVLPATRLHEAPGRAACNTTRMSESAKSDAVEAALRRQRAADLPREGSPRQPPLRAEAGSMTASQQARHVGSWRPGGEKQEKDEEHPSAQVFTADDSTIHHDTSRSLSGRGPEIHRSDSLSKTPSHASCTPTR